MRTDPAGRGPIGVFGVVDVVEIADVAVLVGAVDLGALGDLFFGPLNTCPWSWRRSFGGGWLHLGVVDARLALAVVPCVATEALAI